MAGRSGAPIHLDNHATTPVDPRVLEAMLPYLGPHFGNPTSRSHAYGWMAEEAVSLARARLSALLGAQPEEIVFTAGATESNNIALRGAVAEARAKGRRPRLVTSAIEHPSVLDTCRALQDEADVVVVPVDSEGRVDPQRVADAMGGEPLLVSIMLANNEVGTIQPLAEIARLARGRGALVHCDAAQGVARIPVDVEELGVDLLSLSGHKMYAPKGVGALWVRRDARRRVRPIMTGGGQEKGLRPGTLNVPGIVALGRAAEVAASGLAAEMERLARLRDGLQQRILEELPGTRVNGSREHRLPGNLNVSFEGVDVDALLRELRELAVSTGSACSSGSAHPSHVLTALGLPPELARCTIRYGLGRFTEPAEADRAAVLTVDAVRRLREAPVQGGASPDPAGGEARRP